MARAAFEELSDAVTGAAAMAPGLARHSALVSALIGAGALAQGLADGADANESADGVAAPGASVGQAALDLRLAADAAMAVAMNIAAACAASWSSGFASGSIDVATELARCAALLPTATIAAAPGSGASLVALHAMGRYNTEEALGADLALAWSPWLEQLADLEKKVRPVESDNRLHRWEWLVTADAIVKADALDHHAAHDLVGCQDIACDVAGAIVELDLDRAQAQGLGAAMASGAAIDPRLLAFLRLCYCAFQLGYYVEAQKACGGAEEAMRLGASADRYRESLRSALLTQSVTAGTDTA